MPLLHTLPFIAYLLAGLLLTRYFVLDTVSSQHRLIVNLMLLVAVSSHGYILFEMWQHDGVFFGLTVSISFVAWVVATLLFLTSFTKPIHSLGMLVYPLSALAVIVSFMFPGNEGNSSQSRLQRMFFCQLERTPFSLLRWANRSFSVFRSDSCTSTTSTLL